MQLKVIGLARDLRTSTPVVYAQMAVADYLNIVGNEFENFSIQRRRESHKAYQRLKSDIKDGALLPSITLAVKPDKVSTILPLFCSAELNTSNLASLELALSTPGNVDILDGLQRTYIMKDLEKEGHVFVSGQKLLVEFWLESDLKKLVYRIIILNAGQKPMSIRHQLELLFMSLKTSVENSIPGLEIYTERDNTRRRRARKFPLSSIVSGYQAFITASSELQKDNVIANQLISNSALDLSESEISEQFGKFNQYFALYADLDEEVSRIYRNNVLGDGDFGVGLEGDNEASSTQINYSNWLATENVMMAFFAAISQFSSSDLRSQRVDAAVRTLLALLRESREGSDPLGLETFERLRAGNNPRKVNVGLATRRLLTNGFKEFFRESGESALSDCWTIAVE
ncbi:hypothetical protein [Roseococcus suduntuyensis]|uniref:DGQHR domain-containing protein n=1 Tax=Roseococcus suduntuyensis TaxID=455361 RepID=A0A840A827_9PROT|nr:hypothetical protein [Roseococcus suduntuyensis]MBB3897679.1 hypothetical protein [Roseococcus suduntuyensis]